MAYPSNLRGLSDPSLIKTGDLRSYVAELQEALVDLAAQLEDFEVESVTNVVENPYDDAYLRSQVDDLDRHVRSPW